MKSTSELWKNEYQQQGIPSSYRDDPTKTLHHFLSFLQRNGLHEGEALDLGSGRGRNAFYLAENGYRVTCFELVEENVRTINQKAQSLNRSVTAFCQDLGTFWPLQDGSFDMAIDIFCYKHITSKEAQNLYRESLFRALKPKGYYFLNLASEDDGFYGPLLASSPDPSIKLIVDPLSNISSLLYNQDEIVHEFAENFQMIESKKITSTSPMYGKEYQRQVLSLIFQKKG